MIWFFIISFVNVFLHTLRSILLIKSDKLTSSIANCICYTFAAVVVKEIADNDLVTSVIILAATNFIGCYIATWLYEYLERKNIKIFNKNLK